MGRVFIDFKIDSAHIVTGHSTELPGSPLNTIAVTAIQAKLHHRNGHAKQALRL